MLERFHRAASRLLNRQISSCQVSGESHATFYPLHALHVVCSVCLLHRLLQSHGCCMLAAVSYFFRGCQSCSPEGRWLHNITSECAAPSQACMQVCAAVTSRNPKAHFIPLAVPGRLPGRLVLLLQSVLVLLRAHQFSGYSTRRVQWAATGELAASSRLCSTCVTVLVVHLQTGR
jgi:hypothetical protein